MDISVIKDKAEARTLAESVIPVANWIGNIHKDIWDHHFKIITWVHSHSALNSANLKSRIAALGNIIGEAPSYCAVYGSGHHYTAVWSFLVPTKTRIIKAALFYNTRGTELSVQRDTTNDELAEVIAKMYSIIIQGKLKE